MIHRAKVLPVDRSIHCGTLVGMLLLWTQASVSGMQLPRTGVRSHGRRVSSRRPAMMAVSREDAESNARLVKALFDSDNPAGMGSDEQLNALWEVEEAIEKDPNIASHLQLDLDEDGNPVQLRFLYVDELECIGCTYCASIARNSFFMEPEAGRARAFAQGADDPETISEAIDSCPVNCISFVDYEVRRRPPRTLVPGSAASQPSRRHAPAGPGHPRDGARRDRH